MDPEFELRCLQEFGFTSDKVKHIVQVWKKKKQYADKYNPVYAVKRRKIKDADNHSPTLTSSE
jgi:hypothetical protein